MKNELVVQKLLRYTEKILGYCVNLSFEEFISDSKPDPSAPWGTGRRPSETRNSAKGI